MKTSFILFAAIFFMACQSDDATPETPVTQAEFDVTKATLLKQGMLEGVNHTASGTASLYESGGKKIILLDPYESQNGPDLKVYFSKDIDANEYIRLGPLKSTTGMQWYEVPGNPDVSKYNYVHIWCEKFTVVFGRAEIK